MNILIIYTHPNRQSLNGSILNTFQTNIAPRHNVKVIDLYQDHFNPVLFFDNEHKRRDLVNSQETKNYRETILWSDHIVFIFPIWWSGMPAMLKGFVDKVFVQNFAYSYSTKKLIPKKLLNKKTANIIITHDTPYLIEKFFQKDYGKILHKQILTNMCGIKITKFLSLSNVKNSTLKKRQSFLNKVSIYAKSL